ncbi:MAG TPA: hypothetical protein VNA25_23220 [Phycisphaerae bacterium]|nr:hypothetical protein [Phycisphaerae bacterium]
MASDGAKRHLSTLKRLGATEQVTYRPCSGQARQIDVLVERQTPADMMHAMAPEMTVTALNDAAAGIATGSIDAGADRLEIAERLGGPAASRGIQQIAGQQADWVTLKIS